MVCAVFALMLLALSSYALFTSAEAKAAWIVWVSSSLLIGLSLALIWSCRNVFKVFVVDDREVVLRFFALETRVSWNSVSHVQLQDGQSVLVGDHGRRISVSQGHPAYALITQTILDRFPSLVVSDVGKEFRLNPVWATILEIMAFALLSGGSLFLSMGEVGFWPGLGTLGAGLLVLFSAGVMPRRLLIREGELEVHGWMRQRTVKRMDVAEIRMSRLGGSGQYAIVIVKGDGDLIQLLWMNPGQFRLWLALTAWKRG